MCNTLAGLLDGFKPGTSGTKRLNFKIAYQVSFDPNHDVAFAAWGGRVAGGKAFDFANSRSDHKNGPASGLLDDFAGDRVD